MKSAAFHDERPLARNCNPMFGLSKERPILDHHPKAHKSASSGKLPSLVGEA